MLFGTDLLTMGVYLPMLVVEPLLTYRFGRVQESMHKAVSKGLRITLGYALLLLILEDGQHRVAEEHAHKMQHFAHSSSSFPLSWLWRCSC